MTMADGKRAYIHRSSFGGKGSLFIGMRLRVSVKQDQRNPGKWCVEEVKQAMSVDTSVLAVGAASPAAAAVAAAPSLDPGSSELYSCTVTDWDQRGFGFLKSDDGRRAYVHNSSCGGEHLQIGEVVNANIVPDPQNQGKWSALNIQRGPVIAAGEEGTVTEWVEAGGYGFLSMDDGRRAYVHRNTFGGKGSLEVGSRLSVTTRPDPRNPGKWCVGEVKSELAPASAEQLLLGSALDAATAQAAVLQAQQQQQQQLAVATEAGTVQDWAEHGGYGFLAMDDGRRAYVHRNTFGGKGSLVVGSRLSVTTKPDPRNPGKWCVGQVLAGLQGEPVPVADQVLEQVPQPQGVPEEGIVADWKEDGGFGFLTMTDGRRAYIHRNSFGGTGSLVVGMGLQVTTKPDPRNPGKWCVGEVLNVLAVTPEEPAPKRQRTGFDQLPPP